MIREHAAARNVVTGESMKISVLEEPPPKRNTANVYADIWEALEAVGMGKALKVECDDEAMAHRLASAVSFRYRDTSVVGHSMRRKHFVTLWIEPRVKE